jgi:hypothetical protein
MIRHTSLRSLARPIRRCSTRRTEPLRDSCLAALLGSPDVE